MRYGPQLKGKTLTDKEVQNLLAFADLDPVLASRHASELSVGQAQRVALARTLANDPEVSHRNLDFHASTISDVILYFILNYSY